MPTPAAQLALIPRRPAMPALAPALVLGATALLAALLFAILNRSGLKMTPDGWAYWEGAVSMAEGRGYSYFSGHPILAWPPLYSLYLAAWTFLFGPTALSVSVAMGVLVSLQAAAWLALALTLAPARGARRVVVVGLVAVFIVAFLELNQRQPLAHSMLYLFLPLQLIFLRRLLQSRMLRRTDVLGLLLTSSLAALSHHLGLAFTLALCAAAGLTALRRRPVQAALLATAMLTAGAWALSRLLLGQSSSHELGLGAESPLTYFLQGVAGCADILAPGPAGWVILAIIAAVTVAYRKDEGVRLAAIVAGLLFATSLAMFVLVHIKDPFSGRFLYFVPLLVIPPLMLRLSREGRWRFSLFCALLLPNQIYVSAVTAVYDRDGDEVPMMAALSREAPPGAMVTRESRLLVGPIDWEEPAPDGPPPTTLGGR